MTRFVDVAPTPETDCRAVVLFGRNVASFKFALGRALRASLPQTVKPLPFLQAFLLVCSTAAQEGPELHPRGYNKGHAGT